MKTLSLNRIKLATTVCVAMASVSLLANAETLAPQTPTNASANSPVTSQSCPAEFYKVKLPVNGKFCQVFAADLPASMIFFVPQEPSDVVQHYIIQSEVFSIARQVKNRYMLQSADKNTTLIISSDGTGTQVDVLVKNNDT